MIRFSPLLPLALVAPCLLATPLVAAAGSPAEGRQEAATQDPLERDTPAVSPTLNPEPRIPVYPHPPRDELGEDLEPGLENPQFERLPSSSPTPEGSEVPDNPVRPMTPVAPAEILDE